MAQKLLAGHGVIGIMLGIMVDIVEGMEVVGEGKSAGSMAQDGSIENPHIPC